MLAKEIEKRVFEELDKNRDVNWEKVDELFLILKKALNKHYKKDEEFDPEEFYLALRYMGIMFVQAMIEFGDIKIED